MERQVGYSQLSAGASPQRAALRSIGAVVRQSVATLPFRRLPMHLALTATMFDSGYQASCSFAQQ